MKYYDLIKAESILEGKDIEKILTTKLPCDWLKELIDIAIFDDEWFIDDYIGKPSVESLMGFDKINSDRYIAYEYETYSYEEGKDGEMINISDNEEPYYKREYDIDSFNDIYNSYIEFANNRFTLRDSENKSVFDFNCNTYQLTYYGDGLDLLYDLLHYYKAPYGEYEIVDNANDNTIWADVTYSEDGVMLNSFNL